MQGKSQYGTSLGTRPSEPLSRRQILKFIGVGVAAVPTAGFGFATDEPLALPTSSATVVLDSIRSSDGQLYALVLTGGVVSLAQAAKAMQRLETVEAQVTLGLATVDGEPALLTARPAKVSLGVYDFDFDEIAMKEMFVDAPAEMVNAVTAQTGRQEVFADAFEAVATSLRDGRDLGVVAPPGLLPIPHGDPELIKARRQAYVDSTIQDGHTLPIVVLDNGDTDERPGIDLFVDSSDEQQLFLHAAGENPVTVVAVTEDGKIRETAIAYERKEVENNKSSAGVLFSGIDATGGLRPPSDSTLSFVPRGGESTAVLSDGQIETK